MTEYFLWYYEDVDTGAPALSELAAFVGVVAGLIAIVVWGLRSTERFTAKITLQQTTLETVAVRLGLTTDQDYRYSKPLVGGYHPYLNVSGVYRKRELRIVVACHDLDHDSGSGSDIGLAIFIRLRHHEIQRIQGLAVGSGVRRVKGLSKALRAELHLSGVRENWFYTFPVGDQRGLRGWLSNHTLLTDPDRLCRLIDQTVDFVSPTKGQS